MSIADIHRMIETAELYRTEHEHASRESRTHDWRAALRPSGTRGRYVGDELAILTALRLAPELAGLVRYDEFGQRIELTRATPWRASRAGDAWTDDDDLALQAWLQSVGVDVRARSAVADAVALVAREHAYHPVREYLRALRWDGTPRLDTWLAVYVGATGPEAYLAAVGRRWLISAVARVMQPGCQADQVLVLEGPQGAGKSRTARALAVRPEWYTDRLPELHTADAAIQLAGRWIVELAELAAIRHTASIEAVKAYLSRTADVYRPPYGRRAVSVPRQCVFVATTNESTYLRDRTGNRRYWPVRCGRIDLDALDRDRDQLYAEAVVAYDAGEPWHLDPDIDALARLEQAERVLTTELEHDVEQYLASLGTGEVTVRDVLVYGLHLDPDAPDYIERAGRVGPQVAAALERAGWHRVRVIGRGPTRRTVYRRGTP